MVVFHALLLASMASCGAATAGVAAPTSEIDCKALGGECESSGTKGLSLMQSGRGSVMPGVNEGPSDSFDLLDEYDQIMPTADARSLKSSLAAQAAQVSLPDHFSDPSFYLMVLLYALGFSVVAKLFRRWQATDAEVIAKDDVAGRPESSKSTPPKAEAAPIFDLGSSSADFDALAEAVRSGDEARCSLLVKTRHAARKEDACGCTALHIAAQCGSSAMAKILIEHGAKVNAREAWEETPLHIAAREGSEEVCELLLEHGAEIDPVNAGGRTPLVVAAHAQKEAVCEMLLAKGAGASGASDGDLPPLLNWLLLRRMFAGAKPQEVNVDDKDSTDEAVDSE
mmetsp:Transcript_2078/g.4085  ORF Transcript_2078/g.4085 Transcript_2078/m.4085 type:complete len:340 (+) Transcript_2078:151-1170(+)